MSTLYRGARVNSASEEKSPKMENGIYRGRRWIREKHKPSNSPKISRGIYRGVRWDTNQ